MKIVYFVRGQQHAAMARTSIASALRIYPHARVLVMTDDPALKRADFTDQWIDLYRFTDEQQPVMLANLEAQIRALLSDFEERELVAFLDADTIVTGDLFGWKDFEVDLVATWRDHVGKTEEGEKIPGISTMMPYNYGALMGCTGPGLLEALYWMRERIRGMHPQYQNWYGNQLALAHLLGPPRKGRDKFKVRAPWSPTTFGPPITALELPCDQYNYTPASMAESLEGIRLLHFKGHSRKLMGDYARALSLPFEEARNAA